MPIRPAMLVLSAIVPVLRAPVLEVEYLSSHVREHVLLYLPYTAHHLVPCPGVMGADGLDFFVLEAYCPLK